MWSPDKFQTPIFHFSQALNFGKLGQALACLAFLVSDRPRSPCLHLATIAQPPKAAGRRGTPLLLLLLVQTKRATDTRRGQPNKPRPGEKADPHNDDEVATNLKGPCNELATNYDEPRRTTMKWLNPRSGISQGILIS